MVKPMLNILCRHSFCDFVKIPEKFLPLPMLEITTKSTYSPSEEEDTNAVDRTLNK